MKILLTGANGYIGARLLPILLEAGHHVVAAVRNIGNYTLPFSHSHLTILELDLLDQISVESIPTDIDVAFYLVHSMSDSRRDFADLESKSILNFLQKLSSTSAKQIIYLSGLVSDKNLSPHLTSRYHVEKLICASGIPYTILRAGIIIGSGSASFEIIRDLTEKLPIMIAPKWVKQRCQPIAVQDVLYYLNSVIGKKECSNRIFDIGGPDILSYKEMLLSYAQVRKLKRHIFVVPVLTPKLSSYWLYFVTSVNFLLASSLVDSVKNEAICSENSIQDILPHDNLGYVQSVKKALDVIEQNSLIPSWKDSLISGQLESKLGQLAQVPLQGCLIDQRKITTSASANHLIQAIWSIGGANGWYYMNWAWSLRGFLDKLAGGVGLKRGRAHPNELRAGYSLDFWRVIIADREHGHLLLYAEMKLPGEAWLEFRVISTSDGSVLKQIASFRPKGVLGRLYWYALFPVHVLIFKGMARAIVHRAEMLE
ncbi:MAG: SDR family oxidoreductase [Parachlamydiaceae bacterium]|nr:SDR family oxidoreductase [Parachlamydiaceae bacterium]